VQQSIEFMNLERERPRAERLIAQLSRRLARRAGSGGADDARLEGVIERHSSRTRFRVSLRLRLPSRTLATREEGPALEPVLREAFREIERQLGKHVALVRKDYLWKRSAAREASKRLRAALASTPPAERAARFALVEPHLDRLYDFIRRELAVRRLSGELSPRGVSAEEVLDAVVLEACTGEKPDDEPVDRWLLRLATARIDAEVRRERAARRGEVRIEEKVPPTPPELWVSTLGEEILDFYEPEEKLRLEDLLPDGDVPTPEDAAARREIRRWLDRVLAALPAAWRLAFVLHHAEGLSEREVARVLGAPEADVRSMLEHARDFIQERVRETGKEHTADAMLRLAATPSDTKLPAEAHRSLAARATAADAEPMSKEGA